ncbi:MAG: hypothetical protein WBI82_07415 [Sphaerochaeta sp.]
MAGDSVTLTMGSWRTDDVEQMNRLLSEYKKVASNVTMKGINTPGQALERGDVASFSAPRGGVSHLAFPALAR